MPIAKIDKNAMKVAVARQSQLTKPPGSLGELENLAILLTGWQHSSTPTIDRIQITIFAGDHGVATEGVSAFPQEVTREMVRNFARGTAAINVLAHDLGAELEVINLGTVGDSVSLDGVTDISLGPGTANFTIEPAMTEKQLIEALNVGRESVARAQKTGSQLYIGGEMGIGNTTAATALACAILHLPPEKLAGPGTGLDTRGIKRKCEIIQRALDLHNNALNDPIATLRCLGGFEIAALVGAYLACATLGVPVLIDGYITTTAALIADRICPLTRNWFLYAHTSAEPGHIHVLESLDAKPLLALSMRLGEGSGAAIAVPILRAACALHNGMATFADTGVSEALNDC
ncbi:MAG: nicotinate-nucleotide--dimethylbenzimidazole phosphoribosyltransferase [Methylococcales bacterium]